MEQVEGGNIIKSKIEIYAQHQVSTINYDLVEIEKRWANLISRYQELKKVIYLPVLTIEPTQEVNFL